MQRVSALGKRLSVMTLVENGTLKTQQPAGRKRVSLYRLGKQEQGTCNKEGEEGESYKTIHSAVGWIYYYW